MTVVVDAVGYLIYPHTREVTQQAYWAPLEVCQEAFADLSPRVQHVVLQTDPLGPTMVDKEALT